MIIRSWVYFWAFCPVSLICMSVLVPGPYCFDYCRYIVQPEVREHESSSSVLLSQDCFYSLGSFVLPAAVFMGGMLPIMAVTGVSIPSVSCSHLPSFWVTLKTSREVWHGFLSNYCFCLRSWLYVKFWVALLRVKSLFPPVL